MLLRRKKTDKGRMTLRKVQEEYGENDVCMGELLDALPADGLSIEEAFGLAVAAKKWADGPFLPEYQRWGTGRIVNNNRTMKTRKNGQI